MWKLMRKVMRKVIRKRKESYEKNEKNIKIK
jgi:hypothetical protein